MRARRLFGCMLLLGCLIGPATASGEPPARELFGAADRPAATAGPRVIGSYAKGCLAGGVSLERDGPGWQAMRLSRNRTWGHPALIGWIERFATEARAAGWPGLLVGDLAQPRGGPMLTGHASHQIGLDADIWLTPMPERILSPAEREALGARSMLREGTREVDPRVFGPGQAELIRAAAMTPEVARIFVHPGIKAALCDAAGPDHGWLRKVRPWWGHDAHFHVRLSCPPGEPLCRDQGPPPAGDGCGDELDWWLSDLPWLPKDPAPKPPEPLALSELPGECRAVLAAPPPGRSEG
jgi:penicillin-insensitive murein DD-endopeptidase